MVDLVKMVNYACCCVCVSTMFCRVDSLIIYVRTLDLQ